MYIPNFGDKGTIKFNVFGKALPPKEDKCRKYKSIKKWRPE